jgi:hypothetical protein
VSICRDKFLQMEYYQGLNGQCETRMSRKCFSGLFLVPWNWQLQCMLN